MLRRHLDKNSADKNIRRTKILGGQNFRRTKKFGGQNFRHQAEFSALLSAEFLSDKVCQFSQQSHNSRSKRNVEN